jgi:hypothetical protein
MRGQICWDAQRGIPYNDVVGFDPRAEGAHYAPGAIKHARAMREADAESGNSPLTQIYRKSQRESWPTRPFRVTTHRGHTVQTFQSLELALEAAESLGPAHYVIDRHGLQIWNPQRKLLRNEE